LEPRGGLPRQAMVWSLDRGNGSPISARNWEIFYYSSYVRKNWGGNRTEQGARTQAVLTSILATAKQQGKNPIDLLVEMLCSPKANLVLNLVPPVDEVRDDSSPAPPLHAVI